MIKLKNNGSAVLIGLLVVATTLIALGFYLLNTRGISDYDFLINPVKSMEKISYKTSDGVEIVGNYWPGDTDGGLGSAGVILLHMMPATKESWNDLARRLSHRGFYVLAIDLRGHGESVLRQAQDKVESLNYLDFSNSQHQASIADVEGAMRFLFDKGVKNIFVGGASIGANLALQFMADNSEVTAGFVLSPGINYRGLKTEPLMRRLVAGQRLFLAAAKDDEGALEAARQLGVTGAARIKLEIYEAGGHGTDLFDSHPDLMDELVDFLAD